MTNEYIFWGGGLLVALIQYLLKDKVSKIDDKCENYDSQILKFNEKYSGLQEKNQIN